MPSQVLAVPFCESRSGVLVLDTGNMPDRGKLVKLKRLVKKRKMTSLRCIVGVRPDGIETAIGKARKDR